MDTDSKMLREMLGVRALGVAWLLGPNTWLLALEGEGCSGNSGIIFIKTKNVPWGGVGFCSMAGSKTTFLHLITSYGKEWSPYPPNKILSLRVEFSLFANVFLQE